MKKKKKIRILLISLLFALFLIGCLKTIESIEEFPKNSLVKDDMTNIAVLIVNFMTYNFEGGYLQYFPPTSSTNLDSLPFEIEYRSPLDFGHIIFKLTPNNDTLFFGTIIWHGQGEIKFPKAILPSDSFLLTTNPINEPLSINHYENITLSLLDELAFDTTNKIVEKADSAWKVIKTLDITKQFSENNYRVGQYLYPPSVGVFIKSRAKWIIFLYSESRN